MEKRNLKYVVSLLLTVLAIAWSLHKHRRVNKTELTPTAQAGLLKTDAAQFVRDMKQSCNNDDCLLSFAMVQLVIDMIRKDGLASTIRSMRNSREQYTTANGEYVWIHAYDRDLEQYVFLYHKNEGMDGRSMSEAQLELNKTCHKVHCPVDATIDKLTKFADAAPEGGFEEYKWFDPMTNEIIVKRSFVQKLHDVQGSDCLGLGQAHTKLDIYVGSGATVRRIKPSLDLSSLVVNTVNILIFVALWRLIDIDGILMLRTDLLFYLVLAFHLYNLVYSTTTEGKLEDLQQQEKFAKELSLSLAGIGFAFAFFFAYILQKKSTDEKRNSLMLLSTSVVYSLLGFLHYKSDNSSQSIHTITEMKHTFIANSVIFLLLALYYGYSTI